MNKIFLVGVIGGLTVAMSLAIVFAMATQSTAQMMGHQGMMEQNSQGTTMVPFNVNGMSTVNNVQITGVSATGSNEVTVNLRYGGSGTGPAVTVVAVINSMALMQGSATMGSMGMTHSQNRMMMQPGGQSMMMGGSSGAIPAWQNNTQWQQWHTQMAQWHGQINSTQWAQMQAWHSQMMAKGLMGPGMAPDSGMPATWSGKFAAWPQTGSNILDAGWTSDATLKVRIDGDGSAYESNDFHVMVFPLTR